MPTGPRRPGRVVPCLDRLEDRRLLNGGGFDFGPSGPPHPSGGGFGDFGPRGGGGHGEAGRHNRGFSPDFGRGHPSDPAGFPGPGPGASGSGGGISPAATSFVVVQRSFVAPPPAIRPAPLVNRGPTFVPADGRSAPAPAVDPTFRGVNLVPRIPASEVNPDVAPAEQAVAVNGGDPPAVAAPSDARQGNAVGRNSPAMTERPSTTRPEAVAFARFAGPSEGIVVEVPSRGNPPVDEEARELPEPSGAGLISDLALTEGTPLDAGLARLIALLDGRGSGEETSETPGESALVPGVVVSLVVAESARRWWKARRQREGERPGWSARRTLLHGFF